jgi:hypothetical protein
MVCTGFKRISFESDENLLVFIKSMIQLKQGMGGQTDRYMQLIKMVHFQVFTRMFVCVHVCQSLSKVL